MGLALGLLILVLAWYPGLLLFLFLVFLSGAGIAFACIALAVMLDAAWKGISPGKE